ncbi:hypothetical protein RD1_0188 [Roseobacter denitrificans OCh 114]|uniref:Uncharacterized protein n=1 Tax=Roseobacter denitrificans (strain ATCC 33942 / OCh 114) TaxID=375451 RepID=Q16DM6_ROSDO|nr:hypothetical protein RD1_0188 [Roseobacter denitrificans OCh 114]
MKFFGAAIFLMASDYTAIRAGLYRNLDNTLE